MAVTLNGTCYLGWSAFLLNLISLFKDFVYCHLSAALDEAKIANAVPVSPQRFLPIGLRALSKKPCEPNEKICHK